MIIIIRPYLFILFAKWGISLKDIMAFEGCCKSTASRRRKEVGGGEKYVSEIDYCIYYRIDFNYFKNVIKSTQKLPKHNAMLALFLFLLWRN